MKKFIALIFAVSIFSQSNAQIGTNAPQVGDVPPPLQLRQIIQGPQIGEVTSEKLKGKLVVLEFWNTGCVSCVAAIPHMNALAEQFESNSIVFLSVSDDDENHLNQFLKEHPMKAWVALDGPANATEQAFHLKGYGIIVLINPAGKVVVTSLPAFLEARHLEEILAGKPCSLHQLKLAHSSSPLTSEQAKALAIQLANAKAEAAYHRQPFHDGQPAQMKAGHWVWVDKQSFGLGDLEAKIELAADGSTNDVALQLKYCPFCGWTQPWKF